MTRIYLSPPHQGGRELERLRETLDSNWIAPLGPQVDAFESEFAAVTSVARVAKRRSNFAAYQELLGDLPGIDFMPEPGYGRSMRWLTCVTLDRHAFGATPEEVRLALEAVDIEARPIWKPMHLQPL